MLKGIDVSYHQGKIDFKKVKESGIDFVILREGKRLEVDSKFFEYVQEALSAGLSILGVYHFSYALDMIGAEKEAEFCIENVKKSGLTKDTYIFYDYEYDTIKKAKQSGVTLDKNSCNNHTIMFCTAVEKAGYRAGIYTNLDFYKNYYRPAVLEKWPIWLADYTGAADFQCLLHQYTSEGSVPGIATKVDLDYFYGENFKMNEENLRDPKRSRSKVVALARSWVGKKEADGSHKSIIDIYNSFKYLPRGVKMRYGWAWCACTWSALAIKLGYSDIMPIEISCGELIKKAKEMGIWVENDGYIPKPADAVLYDWDDTGIGDNVGWPDHIGTVEYVNIESGYMIVIEGNYSDSVKKRTISINGKFIRGFITPKYDEESEFTVPTETEKKDYKTLAREIIAGMWGNGEDRRKAVEAAGYQYQIAQNWVNEILNGGVTTSNAIPDQNQPFSKKVISTCHAKSKDTNLVGTYKTMADLYCRNDAGTNKRALCLIPKGSKVKCYGYYTLFNGVQWLYIQFVMGGIQYTGFSSKKYLSKKVS